RGFDVLLLEEGPAVDRLEHRDLAIDALARLYRNGGVSITIGSPGFPLLQGRCVGGTTVVNGGTSLRPRADVFQHWVEVLGLNALSEEELRPHFAAVEEVLGVTRADPKLMSRPNRLFADFFAREGLHGEGLPRNAPECQGCGMCCYGCTSGAKQSMDQSYIPRAIRAGARVVASVRAERILLGERGREGGFAAAVLAERMEGRTGERLWFHAKKGVILAAGTVHTPYLLMRSGLTWSPHLGRNLTVHPASKVYAEFDEDVLGWQGIPQAFTSEALVARGILFEGVFVPPDVAATLNPHVGPALHSFMRRYRRMGSFGFMIEDAGTGRVVDVPFLSRWAGPLVLYSLKKDDVARIREASIFLARILLKHGARSVVPMMRWKGGEIRDAGDLAAFEKTRFGSEDVELAAFHPLGTARVGRNREEGVIAPDGSVHGCAGVWVADGSALPTALGVNPQMTIMAFARHVALGIEN
ncbi:MAG: GMC family oxidoreductase, partial [Bdellovibrionota bacterium]